MIDKIEDYEKRAWDAYRLDSANYLYYITDELIQALKERQARIAELELELNPPPDPEMDRIRNLSPEEVDAELLAAGFDLDELGKNIRLVLRLERRLIQQLAVIDKQNKELEFLRPEFGVLMGLRCAIALAVSSADYSCVITAGEQEIIQLAQQWLDNYEEACTDSQDKGEAS